MSDRVWRKYDPSRMDDVWVDAEDNVVATGTAPPPGYACFNTPTAAEKVSLKVSLHQSSPEEPKGALAPAPIDRFGPPRMTLPGDSAARKELPLFSGCLAYFPAALAEVASVSKKGNDKHNPGELLHHARDKSMDHQDCILRHTVDAADLTAALTRGLTIAGFATDAEIKEAVIFEKAQRAWRDLADLQQTIEKYRGVPVAPGARGVDVNK